MFIGGEPSDPKLIAQKKALKILSKFKFDGNPPDEILFPLLKILSNTNIRPHHDKWLRRTYGPATNSILNSRKKIKNYLRL